MIKISSKIFFAAVLMAMFVFVGQQVSAQSSTTALTCSPGAQSANIGQTINVSASGGTGTYTWSSPDITVINPNGSGFSATFLSPGVKTLSVMSGNEIAVCVVSVVGTTPTTPPTTPGLPNTGGGYGK